MIAVKTAVSIIAVYGVWFAVIVAIFGDPWHIVELKAQWVFKANLIGAIIAGSALIFGILAALWTLL